MYQGWHFNWFVTGFEFRLRVFIQPQPSTKVLVGFQNHDNCRRLNSFVNALGFPLYMRLAIVKRSDYDTPRCPESWPARREWHLILI